MSETLLLAQNLACNCGYPVFPCEVEKKRPLTRRGFYDATTDPDEIAGLFSHPKAELIGIRTGEASGISVLDIDVKHDVARAWWHKYECHLPVTRTYRTRSGGLHLYFRHAPGVVNSEGKPVAGIDVRGEGGYIIFWFGNGFECLDQAPPAPWPQWLSHAIWPAPAPMSRAPRNHGQLSQEGLDRAVQGAIRRVQEAGNGTLHNALRANARLLGGIQTRAGFSDNDAVSWLMAASGLGREHKAENTILWGLQKGRENPLKDHQWN